MGGRVFTLSELNQGFRYHQAAAMPPASAEAPAIIPTLSHAEAPDICGCIAADIEESKSLAMDFKLSIPASSTSLVAFCFGD